MAIKIKSFFVTVLSVIFLGGSYSISATPAIFNAAKPDGKPQYTFFDMSEYIKGYIWVNGHLLGRCWKIEPQQRLYYLASWLKNVTT